MVEIAPQGRQLENKKCSGEKDVKQELSQAGCRRVSTLVNCLDHDLFYFIHIVKKFTLEKKKKRLKRMQMFFLLICWKISSLIRPYFLFINLNSSF